MNSLQWEIPFFFAIDKELLEVVVFPLFEMNNNLRGYRQMAARILSFMHKIPYASLACLVPLTVTFQSPERLQEVLSPNTVQKVEEYVASSQNPLRFQYDSTLEGRRVAPLRHLETGNLLKHEVFRTEQLTVYYPETPRVPHHLIVAFNRPNIQGIPDVWNEENRALFETIRKITEVYKSISIDGFVLAQFDKPQEGHQGRFVVEIIPHLPGFNKVKNIADKIDCNRYVLFRHANLSPVICEGARASIAENRDFLETWRLHKSKFPSVRRI